MLDDAAQFNRDRWEDLARAGARFTRPWEDWTRCEPAPVWIRTACSAT